MKHITFHLLPFISILWLGTLNAQLLGDPALLASRPQADLYTAIRTLENSEPSTITAPDLAAIDSALLQKDIPYRNRFFLLAGWLGRTQALQAVPYAYRRSTRNANDYDLAMIRVGDAGRVARLNKLLAELTVNDDFVYQLAPKLLYTRRREVIDFFLDEIMQDKRSCQVADSHTDGQINCAYRLLEMVAPLIQDFPLKVGASGDLDTDNYETALEVARSWIRTHRNDYIIVTSVY